MIGILIFSLIVIALIAILYPLYLNLLKNQDMSLRGLATLDRQLIKRTELLAYFLALAKEEMTKDTYIIDEAFEIRAKIVNLKNRIDNANERFPLHIELEKKLELIQSGLNKYPNLKSNLNFMDALKDLQKLQDDIDNAIEFYNSTINALKFSVEIFPSSILAYFTEIKCELPLYEREKKYKPINNNSSYFTK